MLRAFLSSGLSGWFYPALLRFQLAFNPEFTPSRCSKNRPRAHAVSGVRATRRAATKRRNRMRHKARR